MLATILISALLAAAVGAVVYRAIRNMVKGTGTCAGCAGCSKGCGACPTGAQKNIPKC